jgi:hypothetical protein
MFLGLPDSHPNSLVTRSGSGYDKAKIIRKTLISTVLLISS